MKILYITLEDISLHKGSVVHIREIVEGLRNQGHEIGLMARARDPYDRVDHFYNLNPFRSRLPKGLRNKTSAILLSFVLMFFLLFKVLRRYDLLYARDYHTVIASFLPRILWRKKLVFEVNGLASEERKLRGDSFVNGLSVWILRCGERLATRWSDAIVSVTPQLASFLMDHYCCKSEKVKVVSNGVNTKVFRPIDDEVLLAKTREELGISPEHRVVAFVGNLAPWQGVEYLIEMAPSLLKEMSQISFLVVGDGPMRGELEAAVNRGGLRNHFVFAGMVNYEKIPIYINMADLCVLPKRRLKSGYSPLKLFEYMACGKPIVASRVEGLDFIEKEGVGRLVEPEDANSLKLGILGLLREPQKRAAMGQMGLQMARERFDWEAKVREIENILHKLA